MKFYLHNNGAQYRLLAVLLLAVFGISAASAQTSDEINAAILVEGSVVPTWTNDATHPWFIENNNICTPQKTEDSNFTSTISFSYSSTYETELTFVISRTRAFNTDILSIKIDGEEKANYSGPFNNSFKFLLPAGSHTVEIATEFASYNDDVYRRVNMQGLKILEYRELESVCMKEGSLPLTFENDPENKWITDIGYIRSNTQDIEGEASSKISTTFTIDKVSVFSFEIRNRTLYDEYEAKVYLDGALYSTCTNTNWQFDSVVLYPGTHTVEFENRQYSHSDFDEDVTEIRNVWLDQTWYEVTLDTPGELGTRMLQALNGKNLQDAELIKINGSLNSDDWASIKMFTGAKAIDLTGTDITVFPSSIYIVNLSAVMLPSTLTTIEEFALQNTKIRQITIPASVESIGQYAFSYTPLELITFENNSKLSEIGYRAFCGTRLKEFIMPDCVNEIGRWDGKNWHEGYRDECHLFVGCSSLRKLHLSENLTTVPSGIGSECGSLEEVNIPSKANTIERKAFYKCTSLKNIEIPETVTKIAERAFGFSGLESLNIPASVSEYGYWIAEHCDSLREVTLSSNIDVMTGWFNGCNALQKVVLPCATPPSINGDPFEDLTKANIKVFVPDFALDAYKTNLYWYQFTSLQASDEASVRNYWSISDKLTLDGNHTMQGTPSVELMTGGSLIMESDATQGFDTFTYNTRETEPASFLSRSNSVTANRLESRFYVSDANKWFFFSPVTDVNMSDVTFPASDSWVIRYYDGARRASENSTSGNWITVPADGTLHRGEGYIIQATAAGWLNMPAATTDHEKFFAPSEVTLPLADNTCEAAENKGWNFVANPYPSYYDIYYINMQAPITVWDGSTYRAYSLNDADRGEDSFVLRPMQPFFVQKDNAELTSSMPLVGRQINTTIDRTRAPRREATIDPNRLKLNLEIFRADSEEADDYTRIVVNDAAKMDYEARCDASKFMSLDATVAQIYSIGGKEHPMAINERPYADGNVALGVYLPEKGKTYTISARRADCRAWLYDALTGIEHDLTLGDYVFVADKAGTDNSRFTVRLAPVTTAVEDIDSIPVKVTGNAGYITVSAPADSHIAVYAADGRVVASMDAENGATEIPAAAGIYVVKVNDRTFKTIVK